MGRSKNYDEEQVLDKAMKCFWKNGFEHTNVRMLAEEMGINQYSLYASFENKTKLYKRVLQNYMEFLNKEYLQELNGDSADISNIQSMLIHFSTDIRTERVPNSCMMVRSASNIHLFERETQEVIRMFFEGMKSLFTKALNKSVEKGVIAQTTDVERESEYLVGIAQSISIYSKLKSEQQIKDYLSHALDKI